MRLGRISTRYWVKMSLFWHFRIEFGPHQNVSSAHIWPCFELSFTWTLLQKYWACTQVTLPGRIGPKSGEKIAKIWLFKNQSNLDFFEKFEIHMPIRPGRYDESTHTKCFLEAFIPTWCFQNNFKDAIYLIFTLGRIQKMQKSTKSSIFVDFDNVEK